MPDMAATIKLNLEDNPALAEAGKLIASLQGIKTEGTSVAAALSGVEAAGGKAAEGMRAAAIGAKDAEGAVGGLSARLKGLQEVAAVSGEAMSKFGLEAGGAARGVGMLAGGLETLAAAAGPLILIGVALAAVAAAWSALKEGVTEGGQINAAIGQIDNNVKNMGGNFKESGEAVRAWADQLSGATGQSATSLVATVQKMTAAHIDYRTAMQLSKDAELESIASGRNYDDVANALQSAIMGKTRALVQMGIITKEEAKNGIDLSVVNQRIIDSTKGAVEAYQNSLPGAFATTSAQIKTLLVDLGNDSGIAGMIIGVLKAVQQAIPGIKALAEDAFAKVHSVVAALSPIVQSLAPIVTNLQGPVGGLSDSFGHLFDSVVKVIAELSSALAPFLHFIAEQIGETMRDIYNIFKLVLDSVILVVDTFVDITSGDWSKLQKDLWIIADDGLKALDGLFGGYLANILAGIDAFCNMVRDKLGNALSFAAHAYAVQADTDAGGDGSSVPAAKYTADKSLGAYYQDSLKATRAQMSFVSHQAAVPGGSHTHHDTGSGKGGGAIVKDTELGGGGKGKGAGAGGGGTVSGTFYGQFKEQTDAVKESQAGLERVLETNNASLDRFKTAVANATTELGRIHAEDEETAQQVRVLEANQTSLNTVIDAQHNKAYELDAQRQKDIVNLNKASAAHDSLQKVMLANNGGTDAQKVKLQDLTTAHDKAQKTLDGTNKLITENTAALEKNEKQTAANAAQLNAIHKALTDVQVDWDTFSAKMMRDDEQHTATLGMNHRELAKYYNDQYKDDFANYQTALAAKNAKAAAYYEALAKMDEQHVHDENRIMQDASTLYDEWLTKQSKKYREDLATWEMTNAEKVKFYKDALDQIGAVTADNIERRKEVEQAYLQASIGVIQDQKKAYDEALKAETSYVDLFFTDITDKTKGFASFWKSAITDLKSHFIQSFSQMIAQSPAFQNIMGSLGMPTKSDSQDKLKTASDTMKLSADEYRAATTQHHQDTTTNSQSTNTYQQSTNTYQSSTNTFQEAVRNFSDAVTRIGSGSGSGGSGDGGLLGFINGIPNFDGGSFNVGADTSVLDPGGWGSSSNLSANALSLGQDVPVNISSFNGTKLGSGGALPTNLSQIAGKALSGLMIGETVASLTGGNETWGGVGGAIGGAFLGPIGAAVGGFIGGLFGNHSLGPAKQPDLYNPAWGQADVDWNGAIGAQTFGNQQFTAAAPYNVGMGGTPLYKQMENWANSHKDDTSLNDSQKAMLAKILGLEGGNANSDFGVTREANNIAYLANGQQISVPDLIALEQSYNSVAGGTSDIYSVTRNGPDFNTARTARWQQPTTSTGNDTRTITAPVPPQINITVPITNYGTIGSDGIEDFSNKVATQIQRNLATGQGNNFGL